MILNQIIKNKKLIKLFNSSYEIYSESNELLKKEYNNYTFADKLTYSWEKENLRDSFKNNFFTLLMGSVILNTCSDHQRNTSYMQILSCLRQIITSTDNIIDSEEKGLVFFSNLNNIVVKNTMLNIATQEILSSVIDKMDKKEGINLNKKWIEKIYNIACAEALRDLDQYDSYPSSEYIRERIHRGIGGELLELSLIVPRVIEGDRVKECSKGLYKIGMALQALDDLCDIEEDIEDNKANLAVALLREEEGLNVAGLCEVEKKGDIAEKHRSFVENYLNNLIKDVVAGFVILEKNGYPITTLDIRLLLKHLFKIRGLEKFWDMI